MKKKFYSDIDRLRAKKDEDIDFSDCSEMDEEFFKNAKIVMPENKETVTMRLDKEVLEWFRAQGKGYQTRINALLRSYMKNHQVKRSSKKPAKTATGCERRPHV